MLLRTGFLVLVVWTVVAIVAGLMIARLLRRRSEQLPTEAREDFRNSA
jgi:hypothetical protein